LGGKGVNGAPLEHLQNGFDQVGIRQPGRLDHALHPLGGHRAHAPLARQLQQGVALGDFLCAGRSRRQGQVTGIQQRQALHPFGLEPHHFKRHPAPHRKTGKREALRRLFEQTLGHRGQAVTGARIDDLAGEIGGPVCVQGLPHVGITHQAGHKDEGRHVISRRPPS
jgi:hypothetical protein